MLFVHSWHVFIPFWTRERERKKLPKLEFQISKHTWWCEKYQRDKKRKANAWLSWRWCDESGTKSADEGKHAKFTHFTRALISDNSIHHQVNKYWTVKWRWRERRHPRSHHNVIVSSANGIKIKSEHKQCSFKVYLQASKQSIAPNAMTTVHNALSLSPLLIRVTCIQCKLSQVHLHMFHSFAPQQTSK
jgi:hypothetical protein